jgi:hypothetical protein
MGVRAARPSMASSTSMCVLKHGGPPADGGHPGGRCTPAGGGQAGAALRTGTLACLHCGLWGKGGCGGSPNVEAGKVHQHCAHSQPRNCCVTQFPTRISHAACQSPSFKVEPRAPWDLRRQTVTMPVKDPHTRTWPLTLASGHGRCRCKTVAPEPERALVSVGALRVHIAVINL